MTALSPTKNEKKKTAKSSDCWRVVSKIPVLQSTLTLTFSYVFGAEEVEFGVPGALTGNELNVPSAWPFTSPPVARSGDCFGDGSADFHDGGHERHQGGALGWLSMPPPQVWHTGTTCSPALRPSMKCFSNSSREPFFFTAARASAVKSHDKRGSFSILVRGRNDSSP